MKTLKEFTNTIQESYEVKTSNGYEQVDTSKYDVILQNSVNILRFQDFFEKLVKNVDRNEVHGTMDQNSSGRRTKSTWTFVVDLDNSSDDEADEHRFEFSIVEEIESGDLRIHIIYYSVTDKNISHVFLSDPFDYENISDFRMKLDKMFDMVLKRFSAEFNRRPH